MTTWRVKGRAVKSQKSAWWREFIIIIIILCFENELCNQENLWAFIVPWWFVFPLLSTSLLYCYSLSCANKSAGQSVNKGPKLETNKVTAFVYASLRERQSVSCGVLWVQNDEKTNHFLWRLSVILLYSQLYWLLVGPLVTMRFQDQKLFDHIFPRANSSSRLQQLASSTATRKYITYMYVIYVRTTSNNDVTH